MNKLYTTDLSCEENRVVIPESLHTRLLNKIYSYDIFYFRKNRTCISCLFLTIYTINRNLIRIISLSIWYFAVKRIVEEWIYHLFLIMLLLISFYKNLRRRRHSDDIFLFMFFSAAVRMIAENNMHSFISMRKKNID